MRHYFSSKQFSIVLALILCHGVSTGNSQLFPDSVSEWSKWKHHLSLKEHDWNFESPSLSFPNGQLETFTSHTPDKEYENGESSSDWDGEPYSRFDSILNGEDSIDETWLSSSYLTPPPLPKKRTKWNRIKDRQNRKDHWTEPHHDIYDYNFYDQTTYGIPNILRKNQPGYNYHYDYPDYHRGDYYYHDDVNWKQQKHDGQKSHQFDRDDLINDPSAQSNYYEPLPPRKMNLEESIQDFYSTCMYLYPQLQNQYFCTRKPETGFSVIGT